MSMLLRVYLVAGNWMLNFVINLTFSLISDGRLEVDDEIVQVNGQDLRNLTLTQANAALCISAAAVEMVVRRLATTRADKRAEVNVQERDTKVKATVIVINSETAPTSAPLPTPPQHLDDSGVEISENGSCSSAEVEVTLKSFWKNWISK